MEPYKTLDGTTIAVDALDAEEQHALELLKTEADITRHTRTKLERLWVKFENASWAVLHRLYAPRLLSRKDIVQTTLHKIASDLASRIAIAAGLLSRTGINDPTARPKEWTNEFEGYQSIFDLAKDDEGGLHFSLARIEVYDSEGSSLIQQLEQQRNVHGYNLVGCFTGFDEKDEELIGTLEKEHGNEASRTLTTIFEKAFLFAREGFGTQTHIDTTKLRAECATISKCLSAKEPHTQADLQKLIDSIISLGTYYGWRSRQKAFV